MSTKEAHQGAAAVQAATGLTTLSRVCSGTAFPSYIYIYINRDVGEQNLYTHNKVVSFITLKAFHPFSSVDTWE